MKIKIEVEIDTKEDQDELEELIERLQYIRDLATRENSNGNSN